MFITISNISIAFCGKCATQRPTFWKTDEWTKEMEKSSSEKYVRIKWINWSIASEWSSWFQLEHHTFSDWIYACWCFGLASDFNSISSWHTSRTLQILQMLSHLLNTLRNDICQSDDSCLYCNAPFHRPFYPLCCAIVGMETGFCAKIVHRDRFEKLAAVLLLPHFRMLWQFGVRHLGIKHGRKKYYI